MHLFRYSQDLFDGIASLHAKQREAMQIGRGRDQPLQLVNDRLFLVGVLLHVQESNSRPVFLSERKGICGLPLRPQPEGRRKQDILQFDSVEGLSPHIGSDRQYRDTRLPENLFCA